MTNLLRYKFILALAAAIAAALAPLLIQYLQPPPQLPIPTPTLNSAPAANTVGPPQLHRTLDNSFNHFDIWGKSKHTTTPTPADPNNTATPAAIQQ